MGSEMGSEAALVTKSEESYETPKGKEPEIKSPADSSLEDALQQQTQCLLEVATVLPKGGPERRGEKTVEENNGQRDDRSEDGQSEDDSWTGDTFMRRLTEDCGKKRLFVCCDGTWQNASGTVAPLSNVAKLARAVYRIGNDDFQLPVVSAVEEDSRNEDVRHGVVSQIVYYSSGVGSHSAIAADSWYSGAIGKGLTSNILNAYCFICNNYNGRSLIDEIILVGFSRGAYTVRCLAQFISDVGLLRRKGLVFLRAVYQCWKRSSKRQLKQPESENELRKVLEGLDDLLIKDVRIKILAEWDPVSAMGIWENSLSFVGDRVPQNVDHALLAVSLDEKRKIFKPMLWSDNSKVTQCVFRGCHTDIGGGNRDPGLSTVSLFWMISRIEEHSHAAFDDSTLLQFMIPLTLERRWWQWNSQEIRLHNLVLAKGQIHESRRNLWMIPYLLSFTFWDGRRDTFLTKWKEQHRESTLWKHFTVDLLQERQHGIWRRRGLCKRYYGEELQVEPDKPNKREKAFLSQWLKQAEDTDMQASPSDARWSGTNEGLGWGEIIQKGTFRDALINRTNDSAVCPLESAGLSS